MLHGQCAQLGHWLQIRYLCREYGQAVMATVDGITCCFCHYRGLPGGSCDRAQRLSRCSIRRSEMNSVECLQ